MSAPKPTRIAILASGGGSNAQKIISYFTSRSVAEVVLLASNNPASGIFSFGPEAGIPSELLTKEQYRDASFLLGLFKAYRADLIILAGYLKLIPAALIQAYPRHILNIHPSLLPKYGGKGMYGMRVHEAVISNQEYRSGITIHFVNEVYDEGEILLQKALMIDENWDAVILQKEVQKLEHQYFPLAIEKVCLRLQQEKNNV
ncbi:MAG: phosphoribosylglycinamide formyltransferase [Bacteroidota bacterium]